MDLHATVKPLKKVTHLCVWHVKVKVDIVVQRVGNIGSTEAHMQDAAWEACATAGDVVRGAGGAEGTLTHPTWHSALADGALLCGADAALQILRECAVHTMLTAVQQRLSFVEPKPQRPFSRQADFWLRRTALAESEEFAHYLDGFSQHHFSARLQQAITSLQDQI